MDFEAMRAGLAHAIPYNTHLGLETVELSHERGVARLPQDDRLTNEAGDTVAEVTVRWYVRKNS